MEHTIVLELGVPEHALDAVDRQFQSLSTGGPFARRPRGGRPFGGFLGNAYTIPGVLAERKGVRGGEACCGRTAGQPSLLCLGGRNKIKWQ